MPGRDNKMGHNYKYCNVEHHLALVLMLLLHMDASTVDGPTYQHEDPLTRQILTCTRCPAGTHMGAHCTATEETVCSSCPKGHFTQFWNYLPKCLYCSTFCVENQYIKKECTPTNNRVCQCKEGYFWQANFCIKHTECPSGYGVRQNGTSHSDTKCEKCARETFSAVTSSTSPCVEHTNCTSMDLKVVLRGTGKHDNLCSTCKNLQNDGGLSILKHFLPEFFAKEINRRSKLYRFVRHHQNLQGKHSLFSKRSLLLQRISEWIRGATIDQLRKLPMQLRESNIHNTADKLSKMFKELDASNCDCKMATL
ncbi:hypothetical protein R3I93_008678 [Phoxinus phoxinus]|uniref:TNFR-Cys domain-containing protein n=1 Tax=Phoxinus phoxinus TaxID=58324 RepID=A0AAN9D782_9TELE